MPQMTLNVDWLRSNNIRGVFQAGMGDHPEGDINIWTAAGIKNQILVEAYPPYGQICKSYCDGIANDGFNRLSINGALTNKDGRTEFYVNSNYLSHSELDMDKDRPDVVKSMISVNRIEIDAYSVDGIFRTHPELNPENYNLLFLDTQCSEHLVIEGTKDSLKYFDYIQVEIAMQRVYAGSLIYTEWIPMMRELGYKSIGETPIVMSGIDLAHDVTFARI